MHINGSLAGTLKEINSILCISAKEHNGPKSNRVMDNFTLTVQM